MTPEPAPIVPIRQELAPVSHETLSKLILEQDLAKLTPSQRLEYVLGMYSRLGLDPVAGGLQLIVLNQKLRLYADKTLAAQLSSKHGVRTEILSQVTEGDLRIVTARATAADGRSSDDVGAVGIKGLAGETLANALMKAVTKAKRRAVLSCVGLGLLDESEVDTIPGARRVKHEEVGQASQQERSTRVRAEPEVVAEAPAGDGIPYEPEGRAAEGSKKPTRYVAPAKGWWDEPMEPSGGHSWKHMAEHYPEVLVDIAVAAGKKHGRRPTEEDDAGWSEREISALRSLERFNVKPLEEARAKMRADLLAEKSIEPPPPVKPETNDPSTWAENWPQQWCGCGPTPEDTWQQVVGSKPDFVRDFLRKKKAEQPDFTKWDVKAAKMLAAVKLFAAHLLAK